MKDIGKGSAAIAAVLCRVIDYYVAKQAQAVLEENSFDRTAAEFQQARQRCGVAEVRIAEAVANIAVEVME